MREYPQNGSGDTRLLQPAAPFAVVAEALQGNASKNIAERFRRAKGVDLLTRLMQTVGLDRGLWRFKVLRQVACSGGQQDARIVLVRKEQYGVILRCRPGDNSTAALLRLVVDRSRPEPVDEVFSRLARHLGKEDSKVPARAGVPTSRPTVDDDSMTELLLALASLEGSGVSWTDPQKLLGHALLEIGRDEKVVDWLPVVEAAVAQGRIDRNYRLLGPGRRFIDLPEEQPAPPPTPPPVPPTRPAPPPQQTQTAVIPAAQPAADFVDTVVGVADNIATFLQMAAGLKAARDRVRALKEKHDLTLQEMRRRQDAELDEVRERHETTRKQVVGQQASELARAERELEELAGQIKGQDLGSFGNLFRSK